MNTYKITWYKGFPTNPDITGYNLIRANSENEALLIFNNEYLPQHKHWNSIVNCSTPEYQAAYDKAYFDSNGRRRF